MKTTCNQKLLFITDDPHMRIGSDIYSSNSVNYFFFSLNSYFKNFRVSCPAMKGTQIDPRFPHLIDILENCQISERPYYFHKKEILTQPFNLLKSLKLFLKDILWADIIFYRLPSLFVGPLGIIFSFFRKNVVFYIVGDLYTRNRTEQTDLKSVLKNIFVLLYDVIEQKTAKRFYATATGMELAQKHQCDIFFTSLIRNKHIKYEPKAIDPENIKLLFIGRLDSNKSVDNLLRAVMLICNENINVQLFIIGSGTEEQRLKNLTNELKLGKQVQFAGSIPFGESLWQWFEKSDIFILPSYSEGIPKVLLEAMAFALPIIATRVGGVPWITDNGKAALLIEPGSPDAIKKAVLRLIKDDTLRKSLVQEGFKIAGQYTFEERLSHLVGILTKHGREVDGKPEQPAI
ncbi:MAG: glycosyltransferase family 4 protein [Desulfobacterales bacterium]|nr:glycosyltransferase family 4 protein [Desulfobacterales bacterium]